VSVFWTWIGFIKLLDTVDGEQPLHGEIFVVIKLLSKLYFNKWRKLMVLSPESSQASFLSMKCQLVSEINILFINDCFCSNFHVSCAGMYSQFWNIKNILKVFSDPQDLRILSSYIISSFHSALYVEFTMGSYGDLLIL
jgi:hypothetical protein